MLPLSLGSSNLLQCLDQLCIAFITGPGADEGRHTSLLVVGQAAKNRLPTGWKWSVCKKVVLGFSALKAINGDLLNRPRRKAEPVG